MNKYLLIIIFAVVILVVGVIYRTFILPDSAKPIETGVIHEITVIAKENEWGFSPKDILTNQGDRIIMTIINEDSYDHGFAIDALGISQRMPANETIIIDFVASQDGDFPFYCSVPCGEGDVNGEHRDHFDMIGNLHVESLISVLE